MTKGGKRIGAGRPKGIGVYGETTKAIRVPESLISEVKDFAYKKGYKIPLYSSHISAGSPYPAEDEIDKTTDLNSLIIDNPEHNFLLKVSGESMIGAGIYPGDIAVVDRTIEAKNGKIIIAVLNAAITIKRLVIKDNKQLLTPENNDFPTITINKNDEFYIWGVVTNVIHKL